jgi:hypothetical protein
MARHDSQDREMSVTRDGSRILVTIEDAENDNEVDFILRDDQFTSFLYELLEARGLGIAARHIVLDTYHEVTHVRDDRTHEERRDDIADAIDPDQAGVA